MKNVTKELLTFAEFLNKNWIIINYLLSTYKDDEYSFVKHYEIIVQANWELLVEMLICTDDMVLDYYSSGADLFDKSYRVTFPEKFGNCRIVVSSKKEVLDYISQETVEVTNGDFFQFLSFTDNYYDEVPPFDKTLVELDNGDRLVIDNENLEFYLLDNR